MKFSYGKQKTNDFDERVGKKFCMGEILNLRNGEIL